MDVQYGFPFDTSKFTDDVSQKPIVRIRDILQNTISTYSSEEIDNKFMLNKNDLLIGMDIITIGDFSISNVGGNTTFSFRVPSIKTVDFVDESQKLKAAQSQGNKIGRNYPCPCGSGKKYKVCHGSNV